MYTYTYIHTFIFYEVVAFPFCYYIFYIISKLHRFPKIFGGSGEETLTGRFLQNITLTI